MHKGFKTPRADITYVLFRNVSTASEQQKTDEKTLEDTSVLFLYCPLRALQSHVYHCHQQTHTSVILFKVVFLKNKFLKVSKFTAPLN
jgi:hypothetical protein